MRAALLLLLAACSGRGTQPTEETLPVIEVPAEVDWKTGPPAPMSTATIELRGAVASLPAAIDSVRGVPATWFSAAHGAILEGDGEPPPCMAELPARVTTLLQADARQVSASQSVTTELYFMRTDLTRQELEACVGKRIEVQRQKRLLSVSSTRGSRVFAWLPGGWVVIADQPEVARALLDAPPNKEPNVLADVVLAVDQPFWYARARDFTGDLLNARSHGAVIELAGAAFEGPVVMHVLFPDAASAEFALRMFATPDELLAKSEWGERLGADYKQLFSRATVTLRGPEIELVGRVDLPDWDRSPAQLFVDFALPRNRSADKRLRK